MVTLGPGPAGYDGSVASPLRRPLLPRALHPSGLPAPSTAAVRADARIPDIDWTVPPSGARREDVEAPSGVLARVGLGPLGGTRVLLVPGATGSKEDFALMMPVLARAGYRVEAYDLAGQYESWAAGPRSPGSPSSHYTLDLFTDDLEAVVATGSTPVHLLGYSFAGTVAAAFTVRHPQQVRSLTLLSAPPVDGQVFRAMKILHGLTSLVTPRVAARILMWGADSNLTFSPPRRARFVHERFALTRRDSVEDILGIMEHTPDLDAALAATGVPILVAAGTNDLWPVRTHAARARRLGAALAIYHAGHSPCETSPYQMSETMLALFRRSEQDGDPTVRPPGPFSVDGAETPPDGRREQPPAGRGDSPT